jgi:hypothetical protein
MIFLVATVAVAAMVFAALDVVSFGDGMQNGRALLCRVGVLASSLAAFVVLRRPRPPRIFDRYVLVWLISLLAMQVGMALLRPVGWSPVQIVNMLLVLGAYTLLPVSTRLTAVPVIAFSLVNLVILAVPRGAGPGRIDVAVMTAYVVANVVGMQVQLRFHGLRRRQFRMLEREREARRRLRAAHAEVKVLRGIVPICSVCKKVRNDEGLYEAVEAYLSRHSEADFSHTLCPECLLDRYPDEKQPRGEPRHGSPDRRRPGAT